MNKKNGLSAKHFDFVVIDVLSMAISLIVSYYIRFHGLYNVYSIGDYTLFGIGIFLCYVFLTLFSNYHSNILKRTLISELYHCIILNVELLSCVIVFLYLFKKSLSYSRFVVVLFFILDILLMTVFRSVRKIVIRKGYKRGKNVSNVIIVSDTQRVDDFFDLLKKENTGYYNIVSVMLIDRLSSREDSYYNKIPLIDKSGLLDYVKNNVVNEAFIVTAPPNNEQMTSLFLNMGVSVNMIMDAEIGELSNVKVDRFGKCTMLSSSINAGTAGQFIVKRLFDILVGIIGLFFTGILYIFLTPIIKKQSPGPVFFAQDRVGKNGKVFKMYKFRSMYMDAEVRKKDLMDQNEMQGLMFKMENDPRIFPAGKFIRKTSIDEFPQFWNILKGDMSLVGTRPPTLDEYQQYSPYHLSRLAIKPGLTGMWQTSGRSDITDFEEVVKLDNEYIRNFSLKLDFKIVLKTFGAVLGMKGSE